MFVRALCWSAVVLLVGVPCRAAAQAPPAFDTTADAVWARLLTLWRAMLPGASCYRALSATTGFGEVLPDTGRLSPQVLALSPRPVPGRTAPAGGGGAIVRYGRVLHPASWQRTGDSLHVHIAGVDWRSSYRLVSVGDTLRGVATFAGIGARQWPLIAVRTACPED